MNACMILANRILWTSSYWHLNSKSVIFIDDVIFIFAQMRLSRLPMINFLPDFDIIVAAGTIDL